MRIRYKKKFINVNLIVAMLWLVNAIIQTTVNKDSAWYDIFWFFFSGVYFVIFFYQKTEEYLTIEDKIIKQNWPFGKRMNFNEIKQIRHFAGEFILTSEFKKMKINIDLIEKESLLELKTELKKLNVEWT